MVRRFLLVALCAVLSLGAPLADAAASPCASAVESPCDCGTPDTTGCGMACAAASVSFVAPAYGGLRIVAAEANRASTASCRFASIAGPPGLQPPR